MSRVRRQGAVEFPGAASVFIAEGLEPAAARRADRVEKAATEQYREREQLQTKLDDRRSGEVGVFLPEDGKKS